ncbi:MAG: ATP-binding protein, partial [Nitrospirae bacterium]|nr:ATP-binding protein [Nitrospirota bacterium]
NRAIILYGPRQAGKTTLIQSLFKQKASSHEALFFNGDDLFTQDLFSRNELEALSRIVGNNKIVVIDEAQRIANIGLTLKLLVDNLPVTVIASGSASFELADKINEPLTGRTKTFWLYPLSWKEVSGQYSKTMRKTALEEMLRFGMYPKIHSLPAREKADYLYEYLNNYLYRDLLTFESIRKPKKVVDLLFLLALQIGKEVSIAELAKHLAVNQKTVESYLDILVKMFILVNLRGFSRNLRKEIYKTSKYYFADTGVRNALIRNFNPLNIRTDAGELFENWFIMEKIKHLSNSRQYANFYFWRTYDQQEIDLIEEREGRLTGYECKFSMKKKPAPPKDWLASYKAAGFKTVHAENCFGFLE